MDSPELRDAIDALYRAFDGYPRPATFRACGCCWTGRDVPGAHWNNTDRPLVEVDAPGGGLPLRSVPASAALAELGTDVPLTGGDLGLMKHYLPRLCEIVTGNGFDDDWPGLPLIASHLSLGPDVGCDPWWNWPPAEQAAIASFFDAAWSAARRATLEEADDTLCAVGLVVRDLRPSLDAWVADDDPRAAANLAALVAEKTDVIASDHPNAVWWWKPDNEPGITNRDQLIAWLRDA